MANSSYQDAELFGHRKLNIRDLVSLPLNDWFRLGKILGFDGATLNDIHQTCHNVYGCKRKMFALWIRSQDHQVDYPFLMKALKEAEEIAAAEKLHVEYGPMPPEYAGEERKILTGVTFFLSGPDKVGKNHVADLVESQRQDAKHIDRMARRRDILQQNLWDYAELLDDDFWLDNVQWRSVIDLGEMIETNEVVPLLLPKQSFHFVCVNTQQHFETPLNHEGTTVGEVAHQALHTVSNMWNKIKAGFSSRFGSLVIGRYSNTSTSDKSLEKTEHALSTTLQRCGCCQGNEVKYCQYRKANILFPLEITESDNATAREHKDRLIAEIEIASKHCLIKTPMPKSIYIFITLCNERSGVLQLDEAQKLAIVCGIKSQSFLNVLRFIHARTKKVLYFEQIPSLSNYVICSPRIMAETLKQLISFIKNSDPSVCLSGKVNASKLHMRNLASLPLSFSQMMDILLYHRFASKFLNCDGSQFYFLPFLLSSNPHASSFAQSSLSMVFPVPRAVCFSGGNVPHGIFYALICHLISKNWKLMTKSQFKNQCLFQVNGSIQCMLVLHQSCIEVRVIIIGPIRGTPSSLFEHVLEEIEQCLDLSILSIYEDNDSSKFNFKFFCPSSSSNNLHFVEVKKSWKGFKITCTDHSCSNFGKTIRAPENYAVWRNVKRPAIFDQQGEDHDGNEKVHNLLQKHLQCEGSLPLCVAKSLFFGPPNVGKTTSRKRITGEMENLEKSKKFSASSTGVENPLSVVLHHETSKTSVLVPSNDSKEWKIQTIESQGELLINCIIAMDRESKAKSLAPVPPITLSNNPANKPSAANFDHMQAISTPVMINPLPNKMPLRTFAMKSTTGAVNVVEHSSANKKIFPKSVPVPDTSFLINLIKKCNWKKLQKSLSSFPEVTLLQLIDTGGQPEFQEILPLLLSGPGLYLLFIDLTQDISKTFEVVYTLDSQNFSPIRYQSQYTVKEVLLQILATIASMNSDGNQSVAFLLGTHADKISKTALLEIENKIRSSEIDKYITKEVLRQLKENSCIFPLNNMSGSSQEIAELRSCLEKHVHSLFKCESLPTSWLVFHLALRSRFEDSPGFCSLEQAVDIGESYSIESENVKLILKYIHESFGTILYYGNVPHLQNLVICNPNIIFKPISNLIAMSFGDQQGNREISELVRRTGQFAQSVLQKAVSRYELSTVVPIDDIIELLKHHNIISEMITHDGTLSYFMPSLLRPDCDQNLVLKMAVVDKLYPSPLLMRFPNGFVPIGLFSCLTVYLSQYWILHDFQQQFKNHIYFISDRALLTRVELIQRTDIIEVRIDCDAGYEARKASTDALNFMKNAMEEIKQLHSYLQNVKYEIGFYCPHSLTGSGHPHFAVCLDPLRPDKMLCYHEQVCVTNPLARKHKIWFSEHEVEELVEEMECSPVSAPTLQVWEKEKNYSEEVISMILGKQIDETKLNNESMQDLMTELPLDLQANWYALGVLLRVPTGSLRVIYENHSKNCQSCFINMLDEWLKSGSATWLKLVQALNTQSLGNFSKVAYDIATNHQIL